MGSHGFNALLGVLILIVLGMATLAFVVVVAWMDQRRKEREAYFRHETLREMALREGDAAAEVVRMMREEEWLQVRRYREGLKLGGCLALGLAVGLWFYLKLRQPETLNYLVSIFPALIGAVLLLYVFFVAPREEGAPSTEEA